MLRDSSRAMFRSPSPSMQRMRSKRSTFPYKRFGRGRWVGRVGTKATGGLAKGIGFGTSAVLLDAGIRGASKAINVGEVEEIDSDQSHSTGLVVVHNKGDSEGSPIATYVMAAATVIFLIMTGPCFFRKFKRCLGKGKKTTHLDPANIPSSPGNLSIPRYPGNQDFDIEKMRAEIEKVKAETYRTMVLDNTEKATRLAESLKRGNMEQEAR